jgi:AcrR family transcriptional regulator
MAKARQSDTADRLLKAATELFAEKGFKAATTREIAASAGVNIASLHYHFRDKEGIYLKVVGRHIDALLEAVPLSQGLPEGASPERLLQALIDAILRRVLINDASNEWKLILRELFDPGLARDMIVERVAKPHIGGLVKAVSALLGPKASQEDIRHCVMSVVSQVVFHRFGRPVIDRLLPEQKYGPDEVTKLSKHIFSFSLAALKARREELEGRAQT